MTRGIVSNITPALSALQERKNELNKVLEAAVAKQNVTVVAIRNIDQEIDQLSRASKQTAAVKIKETTDNIAALIVECEKLADSVGLNFSLQDLGYMTRDEM